MVIKIAVGGFATKVINDAHVKLHNYEDSCGQDNVSLVDPADTNALLSILESRVSKSDVVEIYTTLAGRYSQAIVPKILYLLRKQNIQTSISILQLSIPGAPNLYTKFDPWKMEADLQKVQLELAEKHFGRENQFNFLSEAIQSFNALLNIDIEAAVGRARKIIEIIVSHLYMKEQIDVGKKSKPLFDKIEELKSKNILPKHIYSYFQTIRVLGNLGVHFDTSAGLKLKSSDAKAIAALVTAVCEWFFTEA